jgi:uncharacterized membrane protein
MARKGSTQNSTPPLEFPVSQDRNPKLDAANGRRTAPDIHNASVDEITRRNIQTVSELEHASVDQRTFGEKMADLFAAIVGSWTFIVIQSVLLTIWVGINVLAWNYRWDPYPFILLNLALSFQAAYASPIIMMSQNRQTQLAERRNRLDLQINLLSEQENTEMLRLLRKLCEANHIDISDTSCAALAQETSAEKLLHQIDRADEDTSSRISKPVN